MLDRSEVSTQLRFGILPACHTYGVIEMVFGCPWRRETLCDRGGAVYRQGHIQYERRLRRRRFQIRKVRPPPLPHQRRSWRDSLKSRRRLGHQPHR